jgi:hypothetical protein
MAYSPPTPQSPKPRRKRRLEPSTWPGRDQEYRHCTGIQRCLLKYKERPEHTKKNDMANRENQTNLTRHLQHLQEDPRPRPIHAPPNQKLAQSAPNTPQKRNHTTPSAHRSPHQTSASTERRTYLPLLPRTTSRIRKPFPNHMWPLHGETSLALHEHQVTHRRHQPRPTKRRLEDAHHAGRRHPTRLRSQQATTRAPLC